MEAKYKFKGGDMVDFSYSGITGYGMITGCSLVDMPMVGRHYIVSIMSSNIDHKDYPFSSISLPEHCLSARVK